MARKTTGMTTTKGVGSPPPMPSRPPSDSIEAASIEVGKDVEPPLDPVPTEHSFAGSAEKEEQRQEKQYQAEKDGTLDRMMDKLEAMEDVINRQSAEIKDLRAGSLSMPTERAMDEYIASLERECKAEFRRSKSGKVRIRIDPANADGSPKGPIPVIVNASVKKLLAGVVLEVGPQEIEALLHATKDSVQTIVNADDNPQVVRIHSMRHQFSLVRDESA